MQLLQLLTLQEAVVSELQWPEREASEPTDIAVHTQWIKAYSTHALDLLNFTPISLFCILKWCKFRAALF